MRFESYWNRPRRVARSISFDITPGTLDMWDWIWFTFASDVMPSIYIIIERDVFNGVVFL